MADKRISGLPAISSAAREDLLLVVDDPAGNPSNKKVTLTQFFSNVEPEIVFANTKTLGSSTNASVIFKGGVAVNDSVTIDADLTVNVNAVMNVVSMTAIHSNVQPGTNATHDLGNTTFGWKNAYVGIISGDTGSNLLLAANTNASSNVVFTGANVHIKSNTITSNIVSGTNATYDLGNTTVGWKNAYVGTISGDTISNLLISANTNASANVTFTGALVHTKSNSTIAGTNTDITSNATFTGANVVISGTNTHIISNSTIAGTNTDITSNATFTGANIVVSGTNAYITSNSTIGNKYRYYIQYTFSSRSSSFYG